MSTEDEGHCWFEKETEEVEIEPVLLADDWKRVLCTLRLQNNISATSFNIVCEWLKTLDMWAILVADQYIA